jgi:soluble lytic murein transglycosylase-like protein
MQMILSKIPVSIQVSAVLLSFFSFAACTAFYFNTPPGTMAVLSSASAFKIDDSTVAADLSAVAESSVAAASSVKLEPPVPAEAILLPEEADLSPVGDAVCRDTDEVVDGYLAAAMEAPQPLKEEEPQSEPQAPEPPFHSLILQAAVVHNVEPALIKAVILAESNYNPKAVSKRGARGLMQLMPSTAAALGVDDLFDPEDNINGGVKYLRQLLDRFDNDVRLALAAYNAGSRHVRNYNGVPPFRATRLYIKKVFKYQALFEAEMSASRQTV